MHEIKIGYSFIPRDHHCLCIHVFFSRPPTLGNLKMTLMHICSLTQKTNNKQFMTESEKI